MEADSREFLNTPPAKTVRFGGSVAETLAKHKQVSRNVTFHMCPVFNCNQWR